MSASLEREDGLHEKLQSQEPLQVHIACRKAHTKITTIKAEKRKPSEGPSEEDVTPPTLSSKTPVHIPHY